MTSFAHSLTDLLANAHARGHRLVLLFDLDGTLSPLVEHPAKAEVAPPAREALSQLSQTPRVHLGILSGRGLSDLKSKVPSCRLMLSGSSGLELEIDDQLLIHPQAQDSRSLLQAATTALRDLPEAIPGVWLEQKPFSLTVHYRQAAIQSLDTFPDRVFDRLKRFEHRLRIFGGPMSLEVSPDLNWNKGTAVRRMLQSVPTGPRQIVYAGDSENDLDAFDEVAELGGFVLGVGFSAPRVVNGQFESPHALGRWLKDLGANLSPLPRRHTGDHTKQRPE